MLCVCKNHHMHNILQKRAIEGISRLPNFKTERQSSPALSPINENSMHLSNITAHHGRDASAHQLGRGEKRPGNYFWVRRNLYWGSNRLMPIPFPGWMKHNPTVSTWNRYSSSIYRNPTNIHCLSLRLILPKILQIVGKLPIRGSQIRCQRDSPRGRYKLFSWHKSALSTRGKAYQGSFLPLLFIVILSA